MSKTCLFYVICTLLLLAGCSVSTDQQKKQLIKKYSLLTQTQKNRLLCDLTNPLLGRERIVDTLKIISIIEAGANVNCVCEYMSKRHTISTLLGFESVDQKTTSTPIIYFFENNDIQLLDVAFQHGGTIDSSLIATNLNADMWKYLFGRGWSLKNIKKFDPHIALNKDLVDFILQQGFHINDSIDIYGNSLFTSLISLESDDDTTMVAYLYEKGADINHSRHPIYDVIENRHTHVFSWMIRHGARVKGLKLMEGKTLLQFIVENSYDDESLDMVKIMLGIESNVNERQSKKFYDSYGFSKSALELAIGRNNPKIVSLLLEHGAETKRPAADHENAFEIAITAHDITSLKILLNKRFHEAQLKELIAFCDDRINFWEGSPEKIQSYEQCKLILLRYNQN